MRFIGRTRRIYENALQAERTVPTSGLSTALPVENEPGNCHDFIIGLNISAEKGIDALTQTNMYTVPKAITSCKTLSIKNNTLAIIGDYVHADNVK